MYLVFLFFQSSLYMFQTFVFCIVGSDYHVHDYQPLKVTRTAPINMVILVIILFVMELSTSIKVINRYFTEYKVVHRHHHRAKLRHQATCFPELLHVGRRMSSLVEDYQRSPQEHQAGCQDRQPGVQLLLYNGKLFSTICQKSYLFGTICLLLWFILGPTKNSALKNEWIHLSSFTFLLLCENKFLSCSLGIWSNF